MKYFFLSALTLSMSAYSGVAQAEDDMDDIEGEEKKTKTKKFDAKFDKDVREIERGYYAKSTVGGTFYIGKLLGTVYPGNVIGMAYGQDFVDQNNYSMAWEVEFSQGVHNGLYYNEQAAAGCYQINACVQGDLRTFKLQGIYEFSFYPSRRIGLGVRAGGGVMMIPLLMNSDYYLSEVVPTWGGLESPIHNGALPLGMGGLTFEYYTKLGHFSVGVDADFVYVVNFDMGASVAGYMKYTF